MKTTFFQAYRQAPWRVQLQWIGIFLVVLVMIASVAGIYLSVSGRTAATGRRIQNLEMDITDLKLNINDLNTQLAQASSAKTLYDRLTGLDMVESNPRQALYVEVPGYEPRTTVVMAPPPSVNPVSAQALLPEFTSSLWDWLKDKVWQAPVASQVAPIEVKP